VVEELKISDEFDPEGGEDDWRKGEEERKD
jgi:hypothetical protein